VKHFCAYYPILSADYNIYPIIAFEIYTFATTITLARGVPIETVSKMLGHTNITTTQIYARITDSKISNDMQALAIKLEGIEKIFRI
jgi:hypothetical protein